MPPPDPVRIVTESEKHISSKTGRILPQIRPKTGTIFPKGMISSNHSRLKQSRRRPAPFLMLNVPKQALQNTGSSRAEYPTPSTNLLLPRAFLGIRSHPHPFSMPCLGGKKLDTPSFQSNLDRMDGADTGVALSSFQALDSIERKDRPVGEVLL